MTVTDRAHRVSKPAFSLGSRRPSPQESTSNARFASNMLLVVFVLCGWVLLYVFYLSAVTQSRAQDGLYKEFRSDLAQATAPTGGLIDPRTPVALVQIPSIGVDQVVIEGTTSGDLRSGPGHRRDTVLPGQPGTAVIYGRARTYGGPFKNLSELGVGSSITTTTGQGTSTYKVVDVRLAGEPYTPPLPGKGRLTLATAESTFASDNVVYVDADLTTDLYVPPSTINAVVPAAEEAMGTNTAELPLIALWLGAVAVAAVGIVLFRTRLSALLTWIIGGPILIALAWIATDYAMELLPNLI